jgi:hypothetical protein
MMTYNMYMLQAKYVAMGALKQLTAAPVTMKSRGRPGSS